MSSSYHFDVSSTITSIDTSKIADNKAYSVSCSPRRYYSRKTLGLFFSLVSFLFLPVRIRATTTATDKSTSSFHSSLPIVDKKQSLHKYHQNRGIMKDIIVRIHFVRHGETVGNAEGIVCGHMETPLNSLGIQQAKAASISWGNHNQIQPRCHSMLQENNEKCEQTTDKNTLTDDDITKEPYYWRTYSSDLSRAKDTAKYVLDDLNAKLIQDDRLREVAKGVREGRDVKITYEEAMELFLQENKNNDDAHDKKIDLPKNETEQQVFDRVQSWIKDVVLDAIQEELGFNNDYQMKVSKGDVDSCNGKPDEVNSYKRRKQTPIVRNVLATSHSGTIRITVENMVSDQLPDTIIGKNGKLVSKGLISNTSVTVMDIIPNIAFFSNLYKNNEKVDTSNCHKSNTEEEIKDESMWEVRLVEFASDEHIQKLREHDAEINQ